MGVDTRILNNYEVQKETNYSHFVQFDTHLGRHLGITAYQII